MISTQDQSETRPSSGPAIDKDTYVPALRPGPRGRGLRPLSISGTPLYCHIVDRLDRHKLMGVVLHWFLPTNGDSRTDLSLGNAVGAAGSRVTESGTERAPDIGYMGQIARSAEQLGFAGALTPTSSWCEDAWVMTAGLSQVTERFKFLVAFRPGLMSPTLAAQMAATYPAHLRRPPAAQRGDRRGRRGAAAVRRPPRQAGAVPPRGRVPARRPRAVARGSGRLRRPALRRARRADHPAPAWPQIYLGGSSPDALEVAAPPTPTCT